MILGGRCRQSMPSLPFYFPRYKQASCKLLLICNDRSKYELRAQYDTERSDVSTSNNLLSQHLHYRNRKKKKFSFISVFAVVKFVRRGEKEKQKQKEKRIVLSSCLPCVLFALIGEG